MPGEKYVHGARIKCYVVAVRKGLRGPQITLSRTHPNLVRKLFALEVPEIADGTVEIVAIAREAGHRTKIAVRSTRPDVNAKGSCIGPMGARARAVMNELHGEKIDIVDWSEDPAEFVAHALSPARVQRRRDRRPGGPVGPGHRARLPALARHRPGGAERPAGRPADRLAHRHPLGRGGAAKRARGRTPAEADALTADRRRTAERGAVDWHVVGPAGDRARPRRTCVGCRVTADKVDLLRVVVADGSSPRIPARGGPAEGRTCTPTSGASTLAERRRAFPRAFRLPGPLDAEPYGPTSRAGTTSS